MPLLSICIPTWNRADSLRKTLESLAAALPKLPSGSVELCLSDNSSTDKTLEVISNFKPANLTIIHKILPENLGFSSNYWSVSTLATGKFTWITGDDDTFNAEGLAELVASLAKVSEDLIIINSSPWTLSTRELKNQQIKNIQNYFSKLGIFHSSFIGNTVFLTSALRAFLYHSATLKSAYPHMAPVFGLLRSGRSCFVNISPLVIDDSERKWRNRQPLLTSVDMARLATDLAMTKSLCGFATRIRIYYLLIRSLPRAIIRIHFKTITIDQSNPYQSVKPANLFRCYNAVPLAGVVACITAIATKSVAQILTFCGIISKKKNNNFNPDQLLAKGGTKP